MLCYLRKRALTVVARRGEPFFCASLYVDEYALYILGWRLGEKFGLSQEKLGMFADGLSPDLWAWAIMAFLGNSVVCLGS